MSTYGNEPPENPYGQTPPPPPPPPSQPAYGSAPPPQPAYGSAPPPQPAYGGQPAYGAPGAYGGYGAPTPGYDYAGWGARVGATFIDGLLTLVAGLPLYIGYGILIAGADTTTSPDGVTTISNDSISPIAIILILLGVLTYVGFFIWNSFIKQGKTGYTIGKGVIGIKLVKEDTGQPIGAGIAFVRQICHILDGFCYIGYLWPLWDSKKQTFADKIMTTVVYNAPKA